MRMLEIQEEFYYVKLRSSKLLFHNEDAVINWILDNISRLLKDFKNIEVYVINLEKWTVIQVPDKWWVQVAAESERRKK